MKILFLCTGNSCRSRMAEGFAKMLKADQVEAWSAGVEPEPVDPLAIKAMGEAGVDISTQGSRDVKDLVDIDFDYVVTLCGHARESCPVFPGKTRVVHKGFEDPPRLAEGAKTGEEALVHYRRVRDRIREFVERIPGSLEERKQGVALDVRS